MKILVVLLKNGAALNFKAASEDLYDCYEDFVQEAADIPCIAVPNVKKPTFIMPWSEIAVIGLNEKSQIAVPNQGGNANLRNFG